MRAEVVALVLGLAACAGCTSREAETARRPNVLVILVDTLRKDHLSLHGYPRETSKTIDALGAQGWVFDNHIAHASQTIPSTLSMMLSRYPVDHGFVFRDLDEFEKQFHKRSPRYPERFLFLQEVFQQSGYRTAAVMANGYLGSASGFDQGFESFADLSKRAEPVTQRAIGWLDYHFMRSEDPFFLYVHYIDVHSPYSHPARYMKRFPRPETGKLVYDNGPMENVRPEDLLFTESSYDAAIAYVDDQIARLLAALDRHHVREDTVVVVTSDHGDEFMEHDGLGHGTTVFGELVRVPLVIHHPGRLEGGRRVDYLTRHIDVAPTLLELAGIEVPAEFRGASLLRPAPTAFADTGPWRAVYADGMKLVYNVETQATTLFDQGDELDQRPLADPDAIDRLRKNLDSYMKLEDRHGGDLGSWVGQAWSEEEQRRLRELGYIE